MEVRVVVADEQMLFREMLRVLLESMPDLEVVGEAHDGRSALALVKQLQPHLLIVDAALPDLNGVDVARSVCAESPAVKVIVMSGSSERALVVAAFRAGAPGFISKASAKDEVLRAVRIVLDGEAYLSPCIVGGLVRDLVLAPLAPGESYRLRERRNAGLFPTTDATPVAATTTQH